MKPTARSRRDAGTRPARTPARTVGIGALLGALVAAAAAGSAGTAHAQGRGFGAGIIVGEPTGLSGKLWRTHSTAFDFGAAWSFVDGTDFHLHFDILVHRFDVQHVESGKLPVYYGLGVRIKFGSDEHDNDTKVGIRFPVGLDYLFAKDPFDVFVELAPILDLAPEAEVSLNAAAGFRYWFH
jgi:hypothetical protein